MTAHDPTPAMSARRAVEAARTLLTQVENVSAGSSRARSDTLFESQHDVALSGSAVLGVLAAIIAAAEAGHTCTLHLEDEGNLEIAWRQGVEADIEGDPDFLVDPVERTQLRRLMSAGDVDAAIDMLRERIFVLRMWLGFREPGLAWISSQRLLVDSLKSGTWLSTLMQLSGARHEGRAVFLVDGLGESVNTPSFTFVDTGTVQTLPMGGVGGPGCDVGEAFLSLRTGRGWPQVPSPVAVLPESPCGGELVPALASAAHALAWMWLSADPPQVTPDAVTVRYRGVRDLELPLIPQPEVGADELGRAVELWRWVAATGEDPLRVDAAQRAISLAVTDPGGLAGAAGPALRTARTLHDLATTGAVAEALAARRAGREAASLAASAAATVAREAAGKATERSLALTVAGAAVVFATVQEVLAWHISVVALLILATLLLGSLVVVRTVDLAGAEQALDSFDADVGDYRESLSADDLRQIRQMVALRNARSHLATARKAVTWVYGGGASAAAALAVVLALAML